MRGLTKQSRKWIMGIGVLILLLIDGTVVLFAVAKPQSESRSWIMIVIVALAVLCGGAGAVMRIRRTKYAALLQEDFYAAYESIMVGVRNSVLSRFEQKEILLDVADLMLQAQENGRAAGEVVGEDTGVFVRKMIEACGYRGKFAFNLLYGLQTFIGVLIIVQAAIFLMRGDAMFFETTVGVMILPYLAVMSFVLIPLLRVFIAKQKMLPVFLLPALLIALFIAVNEVLHAFGENAAWVKVYLDGEVNVISSWWILIILAAVFIACFLIKIWLRRRSLHLA